MKKPTFIIALMFAVLMPTKAYAFKFIVDNSAVDVINIVSVYLRITVVALVIFNVTRHLIGLAANPKDSDGKWAIIKNTIKAGIIIFLAGTIVPWIVSYFQ